MEDFFPLEAETHRGSSVVMCDDDKSWISCRSPNDGVLTFPPIRAVDAALLFCMFVYRKITAAVSQFLCVHKRLSDGDSTLSFSLVDKIKS